jgi:hypothetical protein
MARTPNLMARETRVLRACHAAGEAVLRVNKKANALRWRRNGPSVVFR